MATVTNKAMIEHMVKVLSTTPKDLMKSAIEPSPIFKLALNPDAISRSTRREQWYELKRWLRTTEKAIRFDPSDMINDAAVYGAGYMVIGIDLAKPDPDEKP